MFLNILLKTKTIFPFKLHCYCLMSNHFHLVLSTMDDEIWLIMKRVMQNYAMYFNHKYGTKGHVFESRYTSRLIENTRYFLVASRYIHLNPVHAGIVNRPMDYKYSSFWIIIAKIEDVLLDYQELLDCFPGDSCARYWEFVDRKHTFTPTENSILKKLDLYED